VAEVIFAEPAGRGHFGRNGTFIAVGLHANRFSSPHNINEPPKPDYIVLQGTSTRGWSNAADLVIPVDELDNVIAMLESLR